MRLFVANLQWDVDDSGLFSLFADAGFEITAAKLARDADGSSRGFGFVDIPDTEAESAMTQLDGYLFRNRSLVVRLAKAQR